MEILLSILLGIGLSAACGFRVFLPLLVMSIAAYLGYFEPASDFKWLGSGVAVIAFAVATVLEVGAYYIPFIDHLLDTIAAPAAVIAGSLAAASAIVDMNPVLKWGTAIVAGGGAAGIMQGITMLLRGGSTTTTAGSLNFVFASFENFAALVTTVLAIWIPVFTAIVVIIIVLFAVNRVFFRRISKRLTS